jgi:hypothetical protein
MGGHVRSDSGSDLSPDDEREAWIQRNAAMLRGALAEPATRARVMQLLTGETERRTRRLAELATELDRMEITIRLGNSDESG